MIKKDIYENIQNAESMYDQLPFKFIIGNKIFSKEDLADWQYREYKKTAILLNKLFNADLDPNLSYLDLKKSVITFKMAIGQETLSRRLLGQLKLGNLATVVGTKTTFQRRKVSIADIYLNTDIDAQFFIDTFNQMMMANSEENQFYNFKANPNHFYSSGSDTSQTVIEMTGGTRIANKFTLVYGDESGLKTNPNPDFQFESAGTGKNDSGLVIGGVRHLMTSSNGVFHARLQVEFPASMPNYFINQHAIHLLVEFSHWLTDIEMKHHS